MRSPRAVPKQQHSHSKKQTPKRGSPPPGGAWGGSFPRHPCGGNMRKRLIDELACAVFF